MQFAVSTSLSLTEFRSKSKHATAISHLLRQNMTSEHNQVNWTIARGKVGTLGNRLQIEAEVEADALFRLGCKHYGLHDQVADT
jgi:hypothetical protein